MSALRVILGIPSAGTPTQPFLTSLARLERSGRIAELGRSVVFGNYIPAQRDLIMREAIAGGYDYLFFVDDDIVLPPDALLLLVETAEADPSTAVVGALYYSRDSSRPIVVSNWDSSDTSTAYIPAYSSTSTDPVDGVGFGCALLRVSVAHTLPFPYFPAHVYIEPRTRTVRQCDEDYRYCERVRRLGHRVRLDARVRCQHFDRGHDSAAPATEEGGAATSEPRMIVSNGEGVRLVPYDPATPRVVEHHQPADLVYITVDA